MADWRLVTDCFSRSQSLLGNADPELFPDPLTQVDQAPAYHPMGCRNRPALQHLHQCSPVCIIELRGLARRLAADQSFRPLGIEPHHPVPHDLQRHSTKLSGLCPCCSIIDRHFHAPAPNKLWVSDFTYVSTWGGFVYVAFVIDVYARRIVGWRVSRNPTATFVLDALEQALHARRVTESLVLHSDRGSQYVSIRYTERLAEAGIEPSVGSVGDSYDNALAESVIGLFKTEVIHRLGPWKSFEAVEYKTLEWVDWFNHQRLLEPIGNIPPAEAEANYYAALENVKMAA